MRKGENWRGKAALGPGWALFAGHSGDNRCHSHPALQLALGDGRPVRAEVDGSLIESPGLLIGPGVPHALNPGPVWLMYVERESSPGRRLAVACRGYRPLDADECDVLRNHWMAPLTDSERVAGLVNRLLGDCWEPTSIGGSLARVRQVISDLSTRPPETWTLSSMAAEASLSPSRFAHLFRAEAGLPVRPYVRWLRLATALHAASLGHSLTEAAHQAGFADAAHLSRTMRRHFGVAPASVLASLRRP